MDSIYSHKNNFYTYSSKYTSFPSSSSSFGFSFTGFDSMNLIIEPTEDLGGLYLGNYDAASDLSLLKKNKIQAVLTVAAGTGLHYNNTETVTNHELIPAMDVDYYDLSKHFDRCFEFIDRCRKFTNVIVHCWAGVSRSATIVIGYLMKKYEFSFDEAHNFVKKKRKQIYPNPGFLRQLRSFDAQLKMKKNKVNLESKQKERPLASSVTLDKPIRSSSMGVKNLTAEKVKKNEKNERVEKVNMANINMASSKGLYANTIMNKNKPKAMNSYVSYYPEKNYVYDRYAYLKGYNK